MTRLNRPLRCLFVITSMPVGGAETLLVNLVRGLDPKRVSPEVVCLKERGPLGEQLAEEFAVHSHMFSGKWDLRVLPRLIRLMRSRQCDAVITVGAGDKMFWGRLAARIAGVPVVASALHSTGWPDGVGRFNRLLTPITDAFIAVADSHGKFLSDFEGFPPEKIHVIRNGVDCDRFLPSAKERRRVRKSLGITDETPLIGIVAALRSEKNHPAFVRAAAALRSEFPAAHWLIIGDGPERNSIESLIGQCSLQDRVHLLGNRADTPELLAALDLFTLCSHNEAFPVSILEALACGIPVVATDVGSVAEAVLPGETGLLVPAGDEPALARAIAALLREPQQRAAMGAAGRELVLRSSSLEGMISSYESMLTELLELARRPSRHHPARVTAGPRTTSPVKTSPVTTSPVTTSTITAGRHQRVARTQAAAGESR